MKHIEEKVKQLMENQQPNQHLVAPVFLRIKNKPDLEILEKLLNSPGLTVNDYMFDQLKELVKLQHPQQKFTAAETEKKVNTHLAGKSLTEYGVWVYYPWSNRLVHILDEEEFVSVRTSRNQYKITPAEKQILAQKKIGVIGLSVGQSVSVTLAMERICGELRLADFDVLELTNYNRIRTGLYNLGLPKVYSVAREIAEIDPFIKVICYPKGLTEDNMHDFFTNGGNLDLLVEESDGFDIKILSRYKARELKIPVIMEASDRCMVDVERFDLEPQRSILHGLVDHLDINTLKSLKSNEEKIPYMLDVLGIDTSSTRLKASMLEIEQSITTWPQLASAVTMGGGITADVSRRMLLNTFTESGRYHVDVEELIGNKQVPVRRPFRPLIDDLFDFEKALDVLKDEALTPGLVLPQEELETIVHAGCQAPSGGNSQPWRWVYFRGALYLFNGYPPNLTILDYASAASFVALGAAIENVATCAQSLGYSTECSYFPKESVKNLVCKICFGPLQTAQPAVINRAEALHYRITNRNLGERKSIESEILQHLEMAVKEEEGFKLHFFSDAQQLDALADILGETEKIRLLDDYGHHDFVNEIRWTREEAEESKDGVDIRTIDLSNSEKVGLQISRDYSIIELLNQWEAGGAFKKLTKKSIDSAGAIGVISSSESGKDLFLRGGRAMEKVWLEANRQGISFQPVSASVFFYIRLLEGKGDSLSASTIQKLNALRIDYLKTLGIGENCREIFIFRLSKSAIPQIKALRKPLTDLFQYT